MNDSSTPAQNPAQLLERCMLRIDTLEMRLTFLDELTDSLDHMVTQQTQQLLEMQAQLQLLYQRMEFTKQQEHGVEPFTVMGDRPPHY